MSRFAFDAAFASYGQISSHNAYRYFAILPFAGAMPLFYFVFFFFSDAAFIALVLLSRRHASFAHADFFTTTPIRDAADAMPLYYIATLRFIDADDARCRCRHDYFRRHIDYLLLIIIFSLFSLALLMFSMMLT